MSKFINLFGMTTAERLKYLESVVDEIYVLINEERIWVYKGDFVSEDTEYSNFNLSYFDKESSILESSQIVYFTNGYIAIVNLVNSDSSVFTVNSSFNLKADKGDTGPQGPQGETGSPALTYSKIYRTGQPASVGGVLNLSLSKLNRVPNVGDICNVLFFQTSSNITYIAVCSVTSIDNRIATASVISIEKISAATVYKHNIRINFSTNSTNVYVVVFNNSSTEMTQTDLVNYLKEHGYTSDSDNAYQCTGTYCSPGSTNSYYPVSSIFANVSPGPSLGINVTKVEADTQFFMTNVNEFVDKVEAL